MRRGVVAIVLGALPLAAAAGLLERQLLFTAGRVALIFVTLMIAFRLLGKRELSSLSPFELVTLMLIPEVLSDALQQDGQLLNGLVALSALLFMVLATSLLAHRFQPVSRVVEAEPTVLVHDGRLRERAMNEERIQPEELMSELRAHGLDRLSQVKWALLESGGRISIIPREQQGGQSTRDSAASNEAD
jgi:uncharacterized membrane protein YcaP (DUF421 family)